MSDDEYGRSVSSATDGESSLRQSVAKSSRIGSLHTGNLSSTNWKYHRVSVTYGHPYMIDVQDCDARLPSAGDPGDVYLDELVRLSVILGRVQKAVYTYVLYNPDPCSSLIRRIRRHRNRRTFDD